MAVLNNSFEGGTDAVTITTGNSGGSSGDAFDTINYSGDVEFDSDVTIGGTFNARLATTATSNSPYLKWDSSWAGASEVWARMYFRVSDPTPSNAWEPIMFFESDGTTLGCDVQLKGTGSIHVRAPQISRANSTYTMVADTLVRLEVHVVSSATVGQIEARLFYGANLEGTTADETFGSTASFDTGDGTVGGITFGICSATDQTGYVMNLDDVSISDVDWIGPRTAGGGAGGGVGNIANYNFDGGSDGTTILTSDTHSGDSWDNIGGSGGTVAYETDAGLHGSAGGKISHTGFRALTWYGTGALKTSENEYWWRCYFQIDDATPVSSFTLVDHYESDGSTLGAQVRFTTGSKIQLREGAGGGYSQIGISAHSIVANTWYRLEVHILSSGTVGEMDARLFYGSNLEGSTPDESFGSGSTWDTGDGDIEKIAWGIGSAPGQTVTLLFDEIGVDDTSWIGSAVASGGSGAITQAYWGIPAGTSTTTPPDTSGVSSILVPATGAWLGASTAPWGSGGSSTLQGLNEWVSLTNHRPHIIGIYRKNDEGLSGVNSTHQAMTDPAGEKHAIPHMHWKIGSGPRSAAAGTWADVAAGVYNNEIDQFGDSIAAYGKRVMFSIYHEPEDNQSDWPAGQVGANRRIDFKNMWQHVRDRLEGRGVTNLVYVLQFMGYSKWARDSTGSGFEEMYAGDDYVDWIAWDPYKVGTSTTVKDSLDSEGGSDWGLLNENQAGVSGWTGFENWAAANHPTKPLMIAEFGINHGGTADIGVSESVAATILENWRTDVGDNIATYTQIKAWEYWNANTGNHYQVQGYPTYAAEMINFCADSHFDQDGDLAI